MKAVMISIQPKWCELICSGKKTLEVRKTKPKLETPFKCYIYETKGNYGSGKVIGEFVCDGIIVAERGCYSRLPQTKTMINSYDLLDYADGEKLYGWNISNLVIYDKPKELSEFRHTEEYIYNSLKGVAFWEWGIDDKCASQIRRPPQSWCYVKEKEHDD